MRHEHAHLPSSSFVAGTRTHKRVSLHAACILRASNLHSFARPDCKHRCLFVTSLSCCIARAQRMPELTACVYHSVRR